MNRSWQWIASLTDDGVDPAVDLGAGVRCVVMSGLCSDDMNHLDSFLRQGFLHDVRRLFLRVNFAAVDHGGTLREIDRVVRAIVEVPELLLIPGRFQGLVLEDFQKGRGLRETSPRSRSCPSACVVRHHVPAGSTAQ